MLLDLGALLGVPVVEAYGMTEAALITMTPPDGYRAGTCGYSRAANG